MKSRTLWKAIPSLISTESAKLTRFRSLLEKRLVAYERTDGQYTLHYSHWGAANLNLKHRISAESPFGGEDTDSTWAKQLLAELADGLEADAVDGQAVSETKAGRASRGPTGAAHPDW